ncbi:MAG: class I SAM-dependent methyltransferase [Planctomycetaceae bacterium]|nr:class I SAM-dependent methyltransferase [Planctomycetaceae bacterium]
MTDADREKWDRKYADKSPANCPAPDDWVTACLKKTTPGRALDLACGLGQNALLLSEWGWDVDAVDISSNGIKTAQEISESREVTVNWICADLDEWRPKNSYHAILTFRFLDWVIIPEIVQKGLKPGGLFCFETFARSQMQRPDNHLKNPAFTVDPVDFDRYLPFLSTERLEQAHLPDRDVVRFLGKMKI